MKYYYNSKIIKFFSLFQRNGHIVALTWGDKVYVNKGGLSPSTRRHEGIHTAQFKVLGKTKFLYYYLKDWIHGVAKYRSTAKAYRQIRLEQEAKFYETSMYSNYLDTRKKKAWKQFKV